MLLNLAHKKQRPPQERDVVDALHHVCPLLLETLTGLHRASSRLLGPVDPSVRARYGRLKFTVRSHKFNKDYLSRDNLY